MFLCLISGASRGLPLPKIIVWAWERPEDLRFLDARRHGVGFLAGTIYLRSDDAILRGRLQPLAVSEHTPLVAVVRIESDRSNPPRLSPNQRLQAANEILSVASARLAGVQIDYDATVSERAFYTALLTEVRAKLPANLPLAITALASWCMDDPWIRSLPIDEAIPMLFRMGPDHELVMRRLTSGGDFSVKACRASLGLSTDEPLARMPQGRRIYLFHPHAWSAGEFNRALTALGLQP